MAFETTNFQDPTLDADFVGHLVDQQASENEAFHNRLWNYYRNPLVPATGVAVGSLNENSRPYFLAQEIGLPARITGVQRSGVSECLTDLRRKEVVIENDIGWRVQTMVDFLFGSDVTIRSLSADSEKAHQIETVLTALIDANGGVGFLQELALFGAVYGFVDIALRIPGDWGDNSTLSIPRPTGISPASKANHPGSPPSAQRGTTQDESHESGVARSNFDLQRVIKLTRTIRLETVEASRILPILGEDDYRNTRYWIQRFFKHPSQMTRQKRSWLRPTRSGMFPESVEVVEILSKGWWQRYEDRKLIAQGANVLGMLPIVHVQNIASPGTYAGLSDVEPLVPLQDELNTRLSDRAHRVTYQSFKMYLGKGIDDFLERPVGPGQMWATQNLQANIEEFGNDQGSPSEDIHIEQVRQALDKVSGVTPLAAGLLRDGVGNLTSGTALKIVLSGLLAKTARKRLTYGKALKDIARLTLLWLDKTGILPTTESDREINLEWPSVLPSDQGEQLRNAQIKQQLGVPAEQILTELGYKQPATSMSK